MAELQAEASFIKKKRQAELQGESLRLEDEMAKDKLEQKYLKQKILMSHCYLKEGPGELKDIQ